MFAHVLLNQNVSLLFIVAVSVGAEPHARRIVANRHAIVLTTAHCVIATIKHWLFVALATVNVIAVPSACPVTSCMLFTAQSKATVWLHAAGVYVFATSELQAFTTFPVIVHHASGNADFV